MRMNGIPKDKDEQLEDALSKVAEIEETFCDVLLDAGEAKANDEIEYAKAFLKADGTLPAREAQAKIDTERFKRERYRLEAIKEFQRAKLKDAQDAVSARQSLLSAEVKTNRAF